MAFPALEAIQGLMPLRPIWLTLLHSLWLGLIVAAVVALILQNSPRLTHRTCYHLLISALVFVAAGSVGFASLQEILGFSTNESTDSEPSFAIMIKAAAESSPMRSRPIMRDSPKMKISSTGLLWISELNRRLSPMAAVLHRVRAAGLVVWSSVVGCLGIYLALGTREIRRIRREALPAPRVVQERVVSLARRLNLRKKPDVRVHPQIHEPCLCGLFQTLVLLPDGWLEVCGTEQLEAVLAHELAHARRRDPIVNLLQRLLEIAFFYHPAIHWISASVRRQREHCADALAVRLTRNPLALARALESVARLRQRTLVPISTSVTLAGESPSLLPRIQELIGMAPSYPQRHIWPLATLPLAGIIAAVVVTAGWTQEPAQQSKPNPAETPTISLPPPSSHPAQPVPEGRIEIKSDRQISYEVRFLNLESKPWRDRVQQKLKPAPQDGSRLKAWILDRQGLSDLFDHIRSQPSEKMTRAPKVTSFENMPAMVSTSSKPLTPRVITSRDLETISHPRSRESRELWNTLATETTVQANGSHLPKGVRFSLDLSFYMLPSLEWSAHVFHDKAENDHPQSNHVTFISDKLTSDIPDGSGFVVSLGIYDERLTSTAKDGSSHERERLITIIPGRIDLTDRKE